MPLIMKNRKKNRRIILKMVFSNPYVEKKKRGFFKYMKMRYFSKEEFADYESNAHKIPRVETDLELIQNPPDTVTGYLDRPCNNADSVQGN